MEIKKSIMLDQYLKLQNLEKIKIEKITLVLK